MTKKRGSKKGQKWPKKGVQKRVKNGPKIDFFRALKNFTTLNESMMNINKNKINLRAQACKKKMINMMIKKGSLNL
jgi:hypothetical protein